MKFHDLDDTVSFHTLFFEIDHETNMLMENPLDHNPNQGLKVKTYWQDKDQGENSEKKDVNTKKILNQKILKRVRMLPRGARLGLLIPLLPFLLPTLNFL
jgi:hypothetical protein